MQLARMRLVEHLDLIDESIPLGTIVLVDLDSYEMINVFNRDTLEDRQEPIVIELGYMAPIAFRCLALMIHE